MLVGYKTQLVFINKSNEKYTNMYLSGDLEKLIEMIKDFINENKDMLILSINTERCLFKE